MSLDMYPAAVRRWGKASAEVGEDIWAEHKKVAAAGSEKTPGGFTFSSAFGEFFGTWTRVVSSLGDTVGEVGGNLNASAYHVERNDNASAEEMSRVWRQSLVYGPYVDGR